MSIFKGVEDVVAVNIGQDGVSAIYIGQYVVYQNANFFTADNFTFETADGYIFNAKD